MMIIYDVFWAQVIPMKFLPKYQSRLSLDFVISGLGGFLPLPFFPRARWILGFRSTFSIVVPHTKLCGA